MLQIKRWSLVLFGRSSRASSPDSAWPPRFFPAILTPQTPPPPKPPAGAAAETSAEVRIVARSQERDGDRVFAAGDVEIRYGDFLLFADRVEYDTVTKDLLAEGNVVVQTGGQVIRAERVRYSLESGRGTVERASGLVSPSVLFEAETLERRQADLFSLKRARVTACTQPNPRWSFGVSKANLKQDDYIEMWDAVVRVKSVPVLYLPYLRYPLKERATGFLLPRIGFAGEKGFSLSQSFYWAMAPNMDATLGVDFYLARGTGAGLEYRYMFPGGTKGDLNLYYFIYKKEERRGPPRQFLDRPAQPHPGSAPRLHPRRQRRLSDLVQLPARVRQ